MASGQLDCDWAGPGPAGRASVSVVVPVYHSEGTLRPLYDRLAGVLAGLGVAWEVVFVDDGSSDGSWGVLEGLRERHPEHVRALQLTRNFGQHNALVCGCRAAAGEVIVTLDDDLQNPPEEIPRLLAKLAEGADVVYGTPAREQHGVWRDLASQVTKWVLQNAMGAANARTVSAFRAFRGYLCQAFAGYRGPYVSLDVLLAWGTTNFAAVTVQHDPRSVGQSNYTFKKLAAHALNMITGFSTIPLRLATLQGFAFTAFGMAVLGYVLGRYLWQGSPVQGFPFLASIIAIFSGAQLFSLGIMGEYLARMHLRTMDRPTYVVRRALTGSTGAMAAEQRGPACTSSC